jgi:hypothetical protein
MRRGVIDGVTVVWRDSPGPLSAELSFGCGHRDEELDTIGLSHFVQLLACPTPEHAGLASHLTTSFTAAGTAGRIVRELADICSVLAGPPDPDRMAEVAAEADPGERFSGLSFDNDLIYPFASLLSRRFGACGPGLIRWPAPDYSVFTAEQVKAHIERFFTASNAVLTLTGQPPSGLRLPLPQGPKPERAALAFKSTPFWYQDEVDGAGISFHAGNGPLPFLVVSLVRTRLGKSVRAVPDSVLLDATRLLKRWRGGDRRIVLDPAGVSIVDTSGAHLTGVRDLVSVTDGEGCWWVGDPGHGCLHDISAFGRAGDRIRQAAPPLRRRLLP